MAEMLPIADRVPLPLSFVKGNLFILCLTAAKVRAIRREFPVDDEGKFVNPQAYFDTLTEKTVVDEDGKPFFAEGGVGTLFFPRREEVVTKVAQLYHPRDDEKKESSPASGSPDGSAS